MNSDATPQQIRAGLARNAFNYTERRRATQWLTSTDANLFLQNSVSTEPDGLAACKESWQSENAEESQADLISPAAQESEETSGARARLRGRLSNCRMQTIVFCSDARSPTNSFLPSCMNQHLRSLRNNYLWSNPCRDL